MRPFVKKWRGEGSKASLYLDDGILAAESFDRAKQITEIAIHDLKQAGLSINLKKSSLTPKQEGVYLGFIINTKNMEFVAPPEKISKLKKSIARALDNATSTHR